MKLELATLQMTVEVKDGKHCYGSPRLEIVQDNTDEVLPLVPDGRYKWTLVLDIDKAERADPATPSADWFGHVGDNVRERWKG